MNAVVETEFDSEVFVKPRQTDLTMLVISIGGSILFHGLLFSTFIVINFSGISFGGGTIEEEREPQTVGIVPARLVRLGEEQEKNKLPDRVVPALPTAPDDGVPVAKKIDPPPPKRKRLPRKRPLNPVEDDKVRDVLSRIRAFGEITEHHTTAGHPSGVKGGDVSDPALARAGSLWARQVSRVIKSYVTYPTIIPDDELRRLRCKVKLKVGRDLIPRDAEIAKRGTSRNQFFDQALLDSFEQMRLKRVKLPRPPAELEEALFGPGLVLNIYGRHLD